MTIYLDNAATSWPKPECVYQAVDRYLRENGSSPGRGGHSRARAAGMIVYEAREALASLFNISDPNRISFAGNATDALNTALFGTLMPGDTVVTTAMEHNAVVRPLHTLAGLGVTVKTARCDSDGRLDMDDLERLLRLGAKAVVITHASNVTGTIMPVNGAGQMAKEYGALLIVDAAQTAGVEEIDAEAMNIDLLAFSGHKGLLGPQGTGGLYVKQGVAVRPLRYGGTGSLSESEQQPDFMPDMLESGTANMPGIAGLLAGVQYIRNLGVGHIRNCEMKLANQLREGLREITGVALYGPQSEHERTAVVSFTLEGLDSSMVSHQLDQEYGIISRGGLHCAPRAHKTIGTLTTGTLRLSPGLFNTTDDIERALKAVRSLARAGGAR